MIPTGEQLQIRFSIYEPDGERIGVLKAPVAWNISRVKNDVPTASISVTSLSDDAKLLEKPCEIGVEWNDGSKWREDIDSRLIWLEEDADQKDPTKTTTLTAVGYGWMLSKATVVLDPLNPDPTDQKRRFKHKSVGNVIRKLFAEAQGRGVIPNMTNDFTQNHDSNGDPWLADDITIDFERGTDLLSILHTLSEQGRIDWHMEGRKLRVFNAGAGSGYPRIAREAVQTTSTVSLEAFAATVTSTAVPYEDGGAFSGDYGNHIREDVTTLLQGGMPRHGETLNYRFSNGEWDGKAGKTLSAYSVAGQHPLDLKTYAFGNFIADTSAKVRYVIVVPDPANTDLVDIATRVMSGLPGGAIFFSGTNGKDWWADSKSGLQFALTGIIGFGLPVIVLDSRSGELKLENDTAVNHIIQNGHAKMTATHTSLVSGLGSALGGLAIMDNGDATKFKDTQNRPEALQARRWLASRHAQKKGSLWVRLLLEDTRIDASGERSNAASAIVSAITSALPSGMKKVKIKESIDPEVTRPPLEAVLIRLDGATEAPVRRTIEEMANVVYGYGDNFSQTTVTSDEVELPWGNWEVAIGQGGLTDELTMQPLLLETLDKGALELVEVARRIPLAQQQWLPYRDFDHADVVLVQTSDAGYVPYEIQQMVLERDSSASEVMCSLIMANAFESRDERLARGIMAASGAVGGSAGTGGSGVRPQPNPSDNRIPEQVTGVTASIGRIVAADGMDTPSISVSWDRVVLATNGIPMDPEAYAISVSVNGGPMTRLVTVPGSDLNAVVTLTDTSETLTAVVGVAAIGGNGRVGVNGVTGTLTLLADTAPPPKPTAPILSSRDGHIVAEWDGKLTSAMPDDLARVELLMSASTPVSDIEANVIGSLLMQGQIIVPDQPYGERRNFRFVAVDFRGNRSVMSDEKWTTTLRVSDFEEGSIGIDDLDQEVHNVLDSATGNNKIVYSSSTPSGSGSANGDIWFRIDGSGTVIGSWRWNGSSWQAYNYGNGVIGNLDAGKITVGTLNGINISGATITGSTVIAGTGSSAITIKNNSGRGTIEFANSFITEYSGSLYAYRISGTGAAMTPGSYRYEAGLQISDRSVTLQSIDWYGSSTSINMGLNQVTVDGQVVVNVTYGSGELRIYSGYLRSDPTYNRTYAQTDQLLRITGNGIIGRSTSSARYKINIQEAPDWKEQFLSLTPKTWFDKNNTESYAELLEGDGESDPEYDNIEPIKQHSGLIAEEMDEAGLGIFVSYDKEGRPDGIDYPALIGPTLQILKDLNNRLEALENMNE